jgi:endonuclease I
VRGDDPLGMVDPNHVSYKTSSNCLSGPCADLPNQNCWEPADKWKGELARTYFYISVSYRDTFTCCETPGTSNAILKPWMLKTLLDWHNRFPATQYELDRNEFIFGKIQQNRNPFIDVPQWVEAIWLH